MSVGGHLGVEDGIIVIHQHTRTELTDLVLRQATDKNGTDRLLVYALRRAKPVSLCLGLWPFQH